MINTQILIIVLALISLEAFAFFPLVRKTGDFIISSLLGNSMSITEIILFAQTNEDRIGQIEKFYEWRQDNLKTVIKGIGGFVVANIALILDLYFKSQTVVTLNWVELLVIITTACLGIIILFLTLKLKRLPDEYKTAIIIFNSLR